MLRLGLMSAVLKGDGMDVPSSLKKGSDVNYILGKLYPSANIRHTLQKFSPVTGIS